MPESAARLLWILRYRSPQFSNIYPPRERARERELRDGDLLKRQGSAPTRGVHARTIANLRLRLRENFKQICKLFHFLYFL